MNRPEVQLGSELQNFKDFTGALDPEVGSVLVLCCLLTQHPRCVAWPSGTATSSDQHTTRLAGKAVQATRQSPDL